MIYGPFWCQRDKAWLRFNVENGVASAEIAPMSTENPDMTWQAVAEGSWPTSYEYGNEKPESNFYSLKGGVLFRTDGEIDRYSGTFVASQLKVDGWNPYSILKGMKERGNPFSSYEKDSAELTPYKELPLTPEMIEARLEQERAVEEERIKQEQEEQRRRQAEEEAKWKEYQNKDIRSLGMIAADSSFFFSELAQGLLAHVLNTELLDTTAKQFSSCSDYLQALKSIIEDNTNPLHEAIITLASRTDVDSEIGLFGDEELRKALLKQKKSFFFNLLREEAKYLSNYFGIEYDILDDELVTERQAAQRELLRTVVQDRQGDDWNPDEDVGLGALDTDDYHDQTFDVVPNIGDPYGQPELSEEELMQQAIALSLEFNHLGDQNFDQVPVNERDAHAQPSEQEQMQQAIAASLEVNHLGDQNFDRVPVNERDAHGQPSEQEQIEQAIAASLLEVNHLGDQNFDRVLDLQAPANLLIAIYNECEQKFNDTFTGKRHKFFTPYESKSDFAKSAGMTILDTTILALAMDKYAVYLLVGAVVGVAAFGAKGLVELASGSESANKSFEISSSILKFTISTAILVVLSPILDVISLATRSGSTLVNACHNNDQVDSETLFSM